ASCALLQKNTAQASLHDYKQLSLLQRRMQEDMLENFEHRSVYSQAELARCQALSNENNQKMKALQEKCSGAIDRISAFLHTLTDNSTTRHDAAAAATAAATATATAAA
uniref:Si:dkeyp-7a3.1 n=2 Tax=Astyanax mexicanus TaxID=7994 RepID=A0A3B1JQ03_ASTMX